MPTLTSLLARDGVVSLDVIEQALQRQVLEGGELDTALLELGAIKDEDLLARYRADSYDLVPALRAQLDDLEEELCEAFPAELARGYQLVPLAKSSNGLVLASAWPLSSDAQQAIADRTGGKIELRIGTELRVLAALERHYGVSLGTRLSRLIERMGGPLRVSEPPPPPARPSAAPVEAPREPAGPPVRVMQVVKLGTVRSLPSATVSPNDVVSTRSSRPSLRALGGRLSGSPRGPLTRLRAMDLLEQAEDRDRVLDAFFSFARQYFSCTVLFALRDDQLLGLEASGLASDMVRSLEIPVPSTGTVHAVVLGRTARIVDLSATPSDLPLVEALGRISDQPAALLPIAIRRRIVAVLYGDRSGEPMTINELWELLHTLPAVSAAFERIIKLHKLQAVQARRASGREAREARAVAKRQSEPPKPSAALFGRNKINTASGLTGRASVAPAPSITPAQPSIAPPAPVANGSAPEAEPASQPAAASVAPAAEPAPVPIAKSARPPARVKDPRSDRLSDAPDTEPSLPPLEAEELAAAAPDQPEPLPVVGDLSEPFSGKRATITDAKATSPGKETAPATTQPGGIYRFARRREQEVTRPGRPSTVPARRHSLTPAAEQDPPATRTLSQPPPGAGSYALVTPEPAKPEEAKAGDAKPAERKPASQRPAPMPREVDKSGTLSPMTRSTASRAVSPAREPATKNAAPAPRSPATRSAPPPPREPVTKNAAAAPSAKNTLTSAGNAAATAEPDPRRETTRRRDPRADNRTPAPAEIVSIPNNVRDAVRESLRAVPAVDAEPSKPIVLDLAAEAQRLLDDLLRASPDEEKPIVDALLRLGDAALLPLQQRFPGPLWFDRHKPRQRMPAGRDLSAAARALHAFGDAALPYVAELLAAKPAETRLCATLFAADMVRPALLWPLYQRLFDPDGQVRLVATETLPLYRNVEGFGEVLKSLRGRAGDEREAVAGRLSAIEAIFGLRDPGSVELLAVLSAHRNRQLSVPAHRALVAITGNDFADSERRWRGWAEKNRGRHRIEWLIDGLMHGDERVRTTAGLELQKLTQVYYGYDPGAAKREREQAQTRYRNWWMIEGRRLFG